MLRIYTPKSIIKSHFIARISPSSFCFLVFFLKFHMGVFTQMTLQKTPLLSKELYSYLNLLGEVLQHVKVLTLYKMPNSTNSEIITRCKLAVMHCPCWFGINTYSHSFPIKISHKFSTFKKGCLEVEIRVQGE